LNGLISIAFSLLYGQLLLFLWTIPARCSSGRRSANLGFAEGMGAYHAAGALVDCARALGMGAPGDGGGACAGVLPRHRGRRADPAHRRGCLVFGPSPRRGCWNENRNAAR